MYLQSQAEHILKLIFVLRQSTAAFISEFSCDTHSDDQIALSN